VSAASRRTRLVALLAAGLAYVAVFVAFIVWDSPSLGIGHLFVVPICLIALVGDMRTGVLAGIVATGFYVGAVIEAPGVPSSQALTGASLIRLFAYVAVGGIVGLYASRNRQLVERLRDLAGRDHVTSVGNARLFDDELARRCGEGRPFTLVLADVDGLAEINTAHGHSAGNAALKRVGEVLQQNAERGDVVARIGSDEFAVLTELEAADVAALAARANRGLAPEGLSVSFGSTAFPKDGETATELFLKADDRLFAAKLVRQNRATVVALAKRA